MITLKRGGHDREDGLMSKVLQRCERLRGRNSLKRMLYDFCVFLSRITRLPPRAVHGHKERYSVRDECCKV